MFEKKAYTMRFYRKDLKGLLEIFETMTKFYPRSTDICWDEIRNEWKLTIIVETRFELEVKACSWMLDKAIWFAEHTND